MPTAEEVELKVRIGPWVFGKAVPGEEGKEKPPEAIPVEPQPPKKTKFTDITIILDRSGSMGAIREATVKSINDYMRSVDEVPGPGCWSLYTFDDPASAAGAGEQFPHAVFHQVDAKHRPFLEMKDYKPRNSTALVDAVCAVLTNMRDRDGIKTDDANKVLVVIVTDGQDNASERTKAELSKMVGECIKDGWDFLYLGANQDSFTESAGYGMSGGTSAGTSPYFAGIQMDWGGNEAGINNLCSNTAGSATVGTRNWKCDGNQSAAALQGNGLPDAKPVDPASANV